MFTDYMQIAKDSAENLRQNAGVTKSMVNNSSVSPNLLGIEPPKHWMEQAKERDGGLKFFGKMLLGGFTGMTPFLFPEMIGSKERYKQELTNYNDQVKLAQQQAKLGGYIDTLQDEFENTPEDVQARVAMMGMPGIETADDMEYVLTGKKNYQPKWQIIDANGYKMRVDANGIAQPEYVTNPDGSRAKGGLTDSQAKKYGFFYRGAPRLRQMHEMEDRGVALDRSTLTQLKAQESTDAQGRSFLSMAGWQEWMDMALTPEEREYITAAMDAGMIALRDESGAAISAAEMVRQLDQTLMFKDYSDSAYRNQREARARKVEAFLGGMPDWVQDEFRKDSDYLKNYDYSRRAQVEEPPVMLGGNGSLPQMTEQEMGVYLYLAKNDPEAAARMLTLVGARNQSAGGIQQ